MGSVYICKCFKVKLLCRKPYPRELKTIGDHVRKVRLDRNLYQPEVAAIIGVDTLTITNWELNRTTPQLHHIPKILDFLGYDPFGNEEKSLEQKIKEYRIKAGITQKELAKIIGVDPTTLGFLERGERKASAQTLSNVSSLFQNNAITLKERG